MTSYQWDLISPVRRDRMLDGERAVQAVTTAARESFYGWLRIASGLVAMQEAAMELSKSSKPTGRGYNSAWAIVALGVPKLAEIEAATRSHAIWLHENREAVEEWHAGLDDNVKRLVNHPRTCHRRYERDQRQKAAEEEAKRRQPLDPLDALKALPVDDTSEAEQPRQEPRQPPQDTPGDTGGGDTPEAEQPRPGVPHAALDTDDEVRRGPPSPAYYQGIDATKAAIAEFTARFGIGEDDLTRLYELFNELNHTIIVRHPKYAAYQLIQDIGIGDAEDFSNKLKDELDDAKREVIPGIKRKVQAEIDAMTETERETARADLSRLVSELDALDEREESGGVLTEAEGERQSNLQQTLKGWGGTNYSFDFEEEATKKLRALTLGIEDADTWPTEWPDDDD